MTTGPITVLGIFVADLTFVTDHFPALTETVIGADFRIGPGGKGSNQAVAARRAGAEVNLLVKTGSDTFGGMARELFAREGIAAGHITPSEHLPTGAASIYLNEASRENAIIVVPGAAASITSHEVRGAEAVIADSRISCWERTWANGAASSWQPRDCWKSSAGPGSSMPHWPRRP